MTTPPQSRSGSLIEYYAQHDESGRLRRGEGCVELVRTRQLIRARLRPGSRVLDVGGGDGVHASWLVDDGHDVEVVDIVPAHVELARQRGLSARIGDARSLPKLDGSVDAVLLLGPLYHLPERESRLRALREAFRVLRPGGVLMAAGINRLAVAIDFARRGRLGDGAAQQVVQRIVAVGRDDTGYDAGALYFHRPSELADEVFAAGFEHVDVTGVEGPAWPILPTDCGPDDPRVGDVVAVANLADDDPAALSASSHLLAGATRP